MCACVIRTGGVEKAFEFYVEHGWTIKKREANLGDSFVVVPKRDGVFFGMQIQCNMILFCSNAPPPTGWMAARPEHAAGDEQPTGDFH